MLSQGYKFKFIAFPTAPDQCASLNKLMLINHPVKQSLIKQFNFVILFFSRLICSAYTVRVMFIARVDIDLCKNAQ